MSFLKCRCHTGYLLFPPGVCNRTAYGNCYTSTNFVLLGMILANHAGASKQPAEAFSGGQFT